jgi:hypothetical protein
MKRSLVLLLALGVLVAACQRPSPERAVAAGDPLQGSYRFQHNGWIFVHLEGPPRRVGFQHGALLALEIADLIRVLKPFLQETTRRDWAFYREAGERILWPKIDAEFRAEIDGIVEGARSKNVVVDRWDIVALNALEELPSYYVPWLEKQQGKPPSTKAPGNCSAFVATGSYTADRKIVIGHNAWTNYITGERWNIIFDIKPQRGFAILMDGLPGVIASSDDFGINSNGLMITETTITGFRGFDPAGSPEFYRARKAMQYSTSIDDYVRIMREANNGGYANDWLLGDNKTGEIALFELGLKESSVRRTKDGYFVGSNFPVDDKLIKAETNFDVNNKTNSPNARRARWEQLMARHKGKIDVELGKQMEADAYDVIFPAGTVQAKVTDAQMAAKMQMVAAMGHPCAPDFKAEPFLAAHPEYAWMRGLLTDMKTEPWTVFSSGMAQVTSSLPPATQTGDMTKR